MVEIIRFQKTPAGMFNWERCKLVDECFLTQKLAKLVSVMDPCYQHICTYIRDNCTPQKEGNDISYVGTKLCPQSQSPLICLATAFSINNCSNCVNLCALQFQTPTDKSVPRFWGEGEGNVFALSPIVCNLIKFQETGLLNRLHKWISLINSGRNKA